MAKFSYNPFRSRKLIFASAIIALTVFITLFFTISIPTNTINFTDPINKSFVSLHYDPNSVLKEQFLMFDSEPIFIPTQWTESSDPYKNISNEALFNDFPPLTTLYDQKMLSAIITEAASITSPVDLLSNKIINPFSGINQNNPNVVPLPQRTASLTVQDLHNFNIVETREIAEKPDFQINDQLWSPLEFLLIVDESVSTLPLLLTQSSGTEEIDSFFKSVLHSSKLKLNALPPGYYKISVSP